MLAHLGRRAGALVGEHHDDERLRGVQAERRELALKLLDERLASQRDQRPDGPAAAKRSGGVNRRVARFICLGNHCRGKYNRGGASSAS
jgi:hypothetical protein